MQQILRSIPAYYNLHEILIDNNLSFKLVQPLQDLFPGTALRG